MMTMNSKRRKEAEDRLARICETCGRTWGQHDFADFLTCLYGGSELKKGGVFTHETAEDVVSAVFDKVVGPEFGYE
jgi:hypothetical protein